MATWIIKTLFDILLPYGTKISKGTGINIVGNHINPMFTNAGREAVKEAFKRLYGVDIPSHKINSGNMK